MASIVSEIGSERYRELSKALQDRGMSAAGAEQVITDAFEAGVDLRTGDIDSAITAVTPYHPNPQLLDQGAAGTVRRIAPIQEPDTMDTISQLGGVPERTGTAWEELTTLYGPSLKEFEDAIVELVTEAPEITEGEGLANPSLIPGSFDENVVRGWIDQNRSRLVAWMTEGIDPADAQLEARAGVQQFGLEVVSEMIEQGQGPEFALAELVRYGFAPAQADILVRETAGEIQSLQRITQDPANIDQAMRHNFSSVEDWIDFMRSELGTSSDPILRNYATADTEVLWSFISTGGLGQVEDQEEATRISQRIFRMSPQGHAFTYNDGQGFVFESEWAKVAGLDGIGVETPEGRALTEMIFAQTANSGIADAANIAPYIGLIAKERGLLEPYLQGNDDNRRAINFMAARAGIEIPNQSSREIIFEQAAAGVAETFGRAVERYGRPELALIAVYDPALAERIYQNGNPQSEEEVDQVYRILERFGDGDLSAIGFGQGMSARYVDELLTVGGAAGAALRQSGATVVNQEDPALLAEQYRAQYQALFMAEPSEAEVQAFISSIQGQRVAAVQQATSEIASGFNIWQGKSYGADEIAGIVQRYDVNPGAQMLARLRGSDTYQALYAHLPTGVTEEEFVNRYRSKVAQAVGADDVSENLDIVKSGMMSGSADSALRQAYIRGSSQKPGSGDETVRSDIASKVRFIRSLI